MTEKSIRSKKKKKVFTELSFKPGVFDRGKKQQNKGKDTDIFYFSCDTFTPIFRDNNNTNNIIILLRVYLPFFENSVVSFTIYRFNHYLFLFPGRKSSVGLRITTAAAVDFHSDVTGHDL